MRVEIRSLSDLHPYVENPRSISQEAVDKVAASLLEFGWRQPVVIDGEGVIVVGHTRWMAARQLGWEQGPVHVAEDLSKDQIRAYRLADNKVGEFTEWDMTLLETELDMIAISDVDIEITGFDPDELVGILADDVEVEPTGYERPGVVERETEWEGDDEAEEEGTAETVDEVPFSIMAKPEEATIIRSTLGRVRGSNPQMECDAEALVHLCRLYRG